MENEIKYKVFVRCITFNHALYIEDAMNGFCMQNTKFPYVCAIFDDASTDGETDVIRSYMQNNFDLSDNGITKTQETDDYILQYAQHKTNKNCYFAVVYLKYNHWKLRKNKDMYVSDLYDNSEYKAECEGDDYWIASEKLQNQVDFLDSHPDYSAHATERQIVDYHGNIIKRHSQKSRDYTSKDMDKLVVKMRFQTASVMRRIKYEKEQPKYLGWDTGGFCWLLTKGKIRFENTVTLVYRTGVGVTKNMERIKWIETNERWSNILYEEFSPKYLSYTGAYLSLTRDILSLLINKKIESDHDRHLLWEKYRKYSSIKINLKNIHFVFILLRNRLYLSIKNIIKK